MGLGFPGKKYCVLSIPISHHRISSLLHEGFLSDQSGNKEHNTGMGLWKLFSSLLRRDGFYKLLRLSLYYINSLAGFLVTKIFFFFFFRIIRSEIRKDTVPVQLHDLFLFVASVSY